MIYDHMSYIPEVLLGFQELASLSQVGLEVVIRHRCTFNRP
jgi:hypothetical protein